MTYNVFGGTLNLALSIYLFVKRSRLRSDFCVLKAYSVAPQRSRHWAACCWAAVLLVVRRRF